MTLAIKDFQTEKDLKELIEAYNKALSKDDEYFVFDGKILYTDYAKYMIEYLKMRLSFNSNP